MRSLSRLWALQLTRLGYDCVYVQRGEQTQTAVQAMQGDVSLQTSRQRLLAQRREFNATRAAAATTTGEPLPGRLAPLKDDGCCIAFKRDAFQLAATPWPLDLNSVSRGAHVNNRTHLSSQRYLKQNVGLIVALRTINHSNGNSESPPLSAPQVILVAIAHIHWDPAFVDVKTRKAAHLMQQCEAAQAELKRFAFQRLPPSAILKHRAASPNADRLRDLDDCPFSLTMLRHDETEQQTLYFAHRPKSLDCIDSSAALPFSPPLICCGDFNSSPSSDVYQFMIGGGSQHHNSSQPRRSLRSVKQPRSSAPLRFLVDVDCIKLARWLRALGIDCVHWSSEQHARAMAAHNADPLHNAPPSQVMFDLALDEPHLPRRILLTKSKSLVQRRNCPPHFMLLSTDHNIRHSASKEFDAMFVDVCRAFDIRYDEQKLYSRCTLCNASFEAISAEQLLQEAKSTLGYDPQIGNDRIPPIALLQPGARLRGPPDDNGVETRIQTPEDIEFHRCVNQQCSQTYWIGPKSDAMANRIRDMLAQNDAMTDQTRANQSQSSARRSSLRHFYDSLLHDDDSIQVSDSEMRNNPSRENGEVRRARASLRNALALSRHALQSESIEDHSFKLRSAYAAAASTSNRLR